MAKVGEAWVAVHPNTKNFFVKLTEDVAKWKGDDGDGLKVPVRPEVDEDAWQKERDAWQKRADDDAAAGKGPTQKVRLTPDDSEKAKRQFTQDLKKLSLAKDRRITVAVDADTARAQAQINALHGTKVTVEVDGDKANAALKLLEQQQRELAARRAEMMKAQQQTPPNHVQMQPVLSEVAKKRVAKDLENWVRHLDKSGLNKLEVKVHHQGFTEAADEAVRMNQQVDYLNTRRISLKADFGDLAEVGAQIDRLEGLEKSLTAIGDKAKIKVEVDATSSDGFDEAFYNAGFKWHTDREHWQQRVFIKPTVVADADLFNKAFEDNAFLWSDDDGWHQEVKLKVTSDFEIDEAELAERLKAVTSQLDGKDVTVSIRADVDGAAAEAKLDHLARDRTAHIDVEVRGDGLESRLKGLGDGKTFKVKVAPETFTDLDDLIEKLDHAHDLLAKYEQVWMGDLTARAEVWVEVDDYAAEERLDFLTRDRTVKILPVVAELDDSQLKDLLRDRTVKVAADMDGVDGVRGTAPVVTEQVERIAESVEAMPDRADVQKVSVVDAPGEADVSRLVGRSVAQMAEDLRESREDLRRLRQRREEAAADAMPRDVAAVAEEDRGDYLRRVIAKMGERVEWLELLLEDNDHTVDVTRGLAQRRLEVRSEAVVNDMLDKFQTNMFRRAALGGAEPNDRRLTRVFNQGSATKRVALAHDKELYTQLGVMRRDFARLLAELPEREFAAGGADVLRRMVEDNQRSLIHFERMLDEMTAAAEGLQRVDARGLQRAAEELRQVKELEQLREPVDLGELAAELRSLASRPEFDSGMSDEERQAVRARRLARERARLDGRGRVVSALSGRDLSAAVDKLNRFADVWDKSVRGATESRMRDSDFTYGLKSGMRQVGLLPSRAAKMFAWGVGKAKTGGGKDLSLPGGKVIANATEFSGIDPKQFGKGSSSKLSRVTGAIGKAHPLGALLSGGLTIARWRMMAGAAAGAVGLVTDSVAGLGAELFAVMKPFGQAMKGVVVAPAMLAGLATSIGAVAMSMGGMKDAFKSMGDEEAFAAALEGLAPSAREFMLAVKDLQQPMSELRKDMQENMFEGMAESFTAMSDNLFPIVQREWPKTARVIGDLGSAVMDSLATPEAAARVSSTFAGINESLRAMEPGVRDFTNGLVRMVEVGAREALPSLGRAFSDLGAKFDSYFTEDRLVRWIDASKHGFKELGGMLGDLGAGVGNFVDSMVAGADASFGDGGVWGAMRSALQDFRDFTASDAGRQQIASFFEGATDTVRQVSDMFGTWGASIVNDVIPATREFMAEHGATLEKLGTDVLQIAANSVDMLGPLVEALGGIMGVANNLFGGAGSEKREKKMDRAASKDDKWLDKHWTQGVDDPSFAVIKDGKREVKQNKIDDAKAEMAGFVRDKREYLDKYKSSADTGEWLQVADAMSRANMQLQMLEGGFKGARQTAEATASVMTMLGDRIVNIPDSKTIEIEADKDERAVNALKSLGATVEEIEGKPGMLRVEFENEMEISGALAQMKSDMENLSDQEIQVRGLDVAVDELAQMKAQLDGMGDTEVAINVSASQVDDVIARLHEIGIAAENVNGSVYLDTNLPEVQQWLDRIGAGTEINGNFVLDSNADEIIARTLELSGMDVTTMHTVVTNAPEVEAEQETLASDTSSTHHVDSNAAEVAAEKQQLEGDTTSKHEITDNADQAKANIEQLNALNTKTLHAVSHNVPVVAAALASLQGKNTTSTHTVTMKKVGNFADGGIVTPMADGGHREAKIAPGGSYILWAENETGGESYIPHAPSKRKRSTKILAETANLFGLNLVNAEGVAVTPMALGGVKYGDPRTRQLSEQNKKRAREEAMRKVEQQRLERERDLKGKKKLTQAELAESHSLEAQLAAVQKRNRNNEDGYARKMTGYKRGQFVYTDVDPSDAEAVRSVDREGLIPENVRISDSIKDWSEIDGRSVGIIRALDSDVYATQYEPQVRGRLSDMERWAVEQGLDPAQVNAARRAVDSAMPLTDLPPEVQAALLSGEDVSRAERWHRDIDTEKLWKAKGSFDEIDWGLIGKYVQGWYGDNLADQVGLNARIARDLPLYNLVNPDDDTWNAALADIRGGKRNVEKEYKERYQVERDIMRDAQKDEKDRQKDRDRAARAARKPDQVRKELERELKKERDQQAQRSAGLNAVREHRAAMEKQQSGQGVVVNQTIGNITAADAGEAAAKFRRKTMVGFENLTGVF